MDAAAAPLVIDEFFQTDDIQTAERLTRQVYPRASLRESKGDFAFEQSTRGIEGANFTRFKLSSRMDIEVDFHGIAAFGLLLGGRYAVESNRSRVDTGGPFLFTPGIGASQSEGLDVLMVNIDTAVLERAAAQQAGADAVRLAFHGNAPASDALSAHWLRTLNYAWNGVMQVQDVFRHDAIRTATFDAIVAAALAAFPIEVMSPHEAPSGARTGAVRRAQHFIEEHAHEPLTVASIAEAARLSVRGLQNGFRRELDVTPLGYLRRVRLQAARQSLVEADATAQQVADIAHRWGFLNLGRFAAEYRTRFGENPAETLRR